MFLNLGRNSLYTFTHTPISLYQRKSLNTSCERNENKKKTKEKHHHLMISVVVFLFFFFFVVCFIPLPQCISFKLMYDFQLAVMSYFRTISTQSERKKANIVVRSKQTATKMKNSTEQLQRLAATNKFMNLLQFRIFHIAFFHTKIDWFIEIISKNFEFFFYLSV